ncbi:MAG: hypothetical protein IT445_19185 [Phycisphaeraceae bacterium]|nr:hypothetical protein [Phycisphaeraceae bacterium]
MARTARILALLVLGGILIWTVPLVLARQATVTTKSGNTLTGELLSEDANQVILEIAGIRTPIPRADIEKIEKLRTPQEEYDQRRAALANDDYEGRYQLAYDMFDKKNYTQSLTELAALKTDFPDQQIAIDRLTLLVNQRMKLEQMEQQKPANVTSPSTSTITPATTPSTSQPTEPAQAEYLTEQQINIIRLWELPTDLEAAKPRVFVPKEALDELFSKYQSDDQVPKGFEAQRAFRTRPGWQQLELIFQIKARDLYDKVQIREDPAPLREFRRTINPAYVARFFRTHFGTGQIEGLKLLAHDIGSTAEAYTNFYIISTAEHAGHKFIDRDQPAESLLLQWGLPREDAKYPAPETSGWRPFFHGLDDPIYANYLQWIDSLYDRPDYGITYPPPEVAPEVAPPPTEAAPAEPAAAAPTPTATPAPAPAKP